ncbi:hypothetical protein N9Y81_00180 [Akkermansiaceae bacterium]|nr:hypothetical protein [Akkermansiaceae bacterium]
MKTMLMMTMLMMTILWKRHWKETGLFLLVSLVLSALILVELGLEFWKGLVWLEMGSLVLLVARVGLTQSGFGTFGGWRARPFGVKPYLMASLFFLVVPMILAMAVRLVSVQEMIKPTPAGWMEVIEDGGVMLVWFAVLFVVCCLLFTWLVLGSAGIPFPSEVGLGEHCRFCDDGDHHD